MKLELSVIVYPLARFYGIRLICTCLCGLLGLYVSELVMIRYALHYIWNFSLDADSGESESFSSDNEEYSDYKVDLP